MDGCVVVWMWKHGWMYGCGSMDGCKDVDAWMDVWMHACMVHGWMHRVWMDPLFFFFFFFFFFKP
jgi:hypothetical protein